MRGWSPCFLEVVGSIPIAGTTFTTTMEFVPTIVPNPSPYGKVERKRNNHRPRRGSKFVRKAIVYSKDMYLER
ncbi:hypothetical protein BDQ94DRAFT_155535 [Aspergillus welwitschiae]|uniref:Uncharacterized protein n=1 Tax=Aspergillus welwitschiae TaxID=1341132 RepID=A0A3F3PI54_9EURO|nr:hypothetical protein BDQ94DRAFT_155535 [Aspergillus welwitschiae]RDH26453.1 hypothetical protein BDQ94DRAFT_155535 [Aspergillus welwitschiae]